MKVGRNPDVQLGAFIAYAPIAMAMFDTEMRYIAVSERWLRDYRLAGSPVGLLHYDVFPEIPEDWKEVHRRCLAGATESSEGEAFERADGRVQWVKWTACPWRDSDGKVGGLILTTEDITARKEGEAEAERSLRASEERFRTLVEEAPDAVLVYDVDKDRLVDANKAAERLFGVSRDEMFKTEPQRFYPPNQPDGRPVRESFPENNRRALAGEVVTFERRVRRPYGEDRLCHVTLVRLPSSTRLLRSSLVDITERRKAEEALRAGEESSRLVEEAPHAILLYDFEQGRVVTANKAAERLFGVSRDEIFKHGPRHFYTPEQPDGRPVAESCSENNERALAGEEVTHERRIRRPSGEERVCCVTLVRLPSNVRLLRASFVDVTERRKAEEALRASEERFRTLFEEAPDAILIIDFDDQGRLIAANKAAERMVGASRYEILKLKPASFFPPEQPEGGPLAESLLENGERALAGEAVTFERRIRRVSGEERIVRATLVRLPSNIRLLRASLIDITEEKRIESDLAAAKAEAERADRAKSKFLAAASHDLRQPVQSLGLLMALAERQIADNPPALKTLGKMRGSLEGLNGLLNAILDVSRLDSGVETRPEVVDLGVLINRLALEYRPKAEERGLVVRTAPRKLWVNADPALLERALRNLIENALRYTPAGGVLVGLRRRGDRVRIDVVDTGIGVPEDKRKDIFDEFVQLNNPGRQLGLGLGLGLAIVDRIARLMEAAIELNSKTGKGSRFSLALPLAEAPADRSGAIADDVQDPGGRVLIIEDNLIVRESLEALLAQWGYETVTVADGEQAAAVAERDGWRFGCIVTDQRLGMGRTGLETAKEILRRSGRALPTLVLTADTARENIAEIVASGFEIMHKPIASEPLRRALARMMSA